MVLANKGQCVNQSTTELQINFHQMMAPSNIQVLVTPHSSSFFAGESLSFTITFRNNLSPSSSTNNGIGSGISMGHDRKRVRSMAVPSSTSLWGSGSSGAENTGGGMTKSQSLKSIYEGDEEGEGEMGTLRGGQGSKDEPPMTAGLLGWQVPPTPASATIQMNKMGGSSNRGGRVGQRKGLVGVKTTGDGGERRGEVKKLYEEKRLPTLGVRTMNVGGVNGGVREHKRNRTMVSVLNAMKIDEDSGQSSSSSLLSSTQNSLSSSPQRQPSVISNSGASPSPLRGTPINRSNTGSPDSHISRATSQSSIAIEGDDDETMSQRSSVISHNFYNLAKNDTMSTVFKEGVQEWANLPTPPSRYGSPFSSPNPSSRPGLGMMRRSPSVWSESSDTDSRNGGRLNVKGRRPPGTERLLWSFAQLEGNFEVDSELIQPGEFWDVKYSLLSPSANRGSGASGAIGGGSLNPEYLSTGEYGQAENVESVDRSSSGGWIGWLWGTAAPNRREKEAAGDGSLEERRREALRKKGIPIFSTPPSILAVDLLLEPGEEKTYKYEIALPADLPPSFKGKAIKFSYQLSVGTNRVHSHGGPQISRVLKVPIRIYNHVAVTGARPFYDLTNPIVFHKDEAKVTSPDDFRFQKRETRQGNGRIDFENYALRLLQSVDHDDINKLDIQPPRHHSGLVEGGPQDRPEMKSRTKSESAEKDVDEDQGCRTAVEIVTRNSPKASFEINKDGFNVAHLILVKTAYRLGETVNGVVLINSGQGRVLRISARLETHELIETTISTKSTAQSKQATRRLHSEFHQTTLDMRRVGFTLSIPSGGTPDFATSGVKLQWSVRLSFQVVPPSTLPPKSNVRRPPSRSHNRSQSYSFGFQPSISISAPQNNNPTVPHLLPVSCQDIASPSTTYRAVPDLSYVPVIFTPEETRPRPTRRSSVDLSSRRAHKSSPSTPNMGVVPKSNGAEAVLVPAKVETVECSIPIKVYPGITNFRVTVFSG